MPRVLVGVGSNMDPEANVKAAIRCLAKRVTVKRVSTVYRNEAIGNPGAPEFYNCAVEIETDLPPGQLKRDVLEVIESVLGRVRTADRFAPRTIDLDIAVYGDVVGVVNGVTLPDPDIPRHPHLAVPLAEIAPDLRLPGDWRALSEIASVFPGQGMAALDDYSEALRRDIAYGQAES